jgi:uncharacterized protein with GYD domain
MTMAKYLVSACYTAEGLKGLTKDKATKRKQAIEQALATVGGKLDAIYWALGEDDAYVICDCPDNVSVAALALATSASGLVRTRTVPLLTAAELDEALAKQVAYRAPGA